MKNVKIIYQTMKKFAFLFIGVLALQACGLRGLLVEGVEEGAIIASRESIAEAPTMLRANSQSSFAAGIADARDHALGEARQAFGEWEALTDVERATDAHRLALDEVANVQIDRITALEGIVLDQRQTALRAAAEAGVIGVAVGGGGVFLANEILAHRQAEKEARCRNLGKMLQEEQDSENAKGLQERIHRECLN